MKSDPISAIVARIEATAGDTNERVKNIEKTLYLGNGAPSIVSRVVALETDQGSTRRFIAIAVSAGTAAASLVSTILHFVVK